MPRECRGDFRDAVGDSDESVAVLRGAGFWVVVGDSDELVSVLRGAGFRVAVGDSDELVAVLVRYR